ncbi:Lipase, partial [Operophtera brumata]
MRFKPSSVLFTIYFWYVSASPNDVERTDLQILEDARLDTFNLIKKYGYRCEIHRVYTEDRYILEMHRVPHGKNQTPGPRPVVFLQHGLLSSSAEWVLMTPGKGLAYILADKGYDVWMGNARGNTYSRRHSVLKPESKAFWQFSWHEIGYYDLPAMIDYVTKETGVEKLQYVGFSQGTTVFWVMASTRPEYNDKIIAMQALAPIAY